LRRETAQGSPPANTFFHPGCFLTDRPAADRISSTALAIAAQGPNAVTNLREYFAGATVGIGTAQEAVGAPLSQPKGVANNRSLMTILVVAIALSCLAAAGAAQEPRHPSIIPLKPFATNHWMEVVSGNPDSAGVPFVARIRNDDGMIVPVHWHPGDEHVVVLKGVWYLGAGDKFDRTALREMHVGDYGFVPKEMLHFAWSRGETVIQVHGIGPFKILPPAGDNWISLSDSGAASVFKYKQSDRVRAANGEGVILDGFSARKGGLIQYRIQRGDGTIFWAEQTGVHAASTRRP
jgi:hypothetical protein